MNGTDSFLDTSVLLYLLSDDHDRADRVEALLQQPCTISLQTLNEFTAVVTRKSDLSLQEVREVLGSIRDICATQPLTLDIYDRGIEIAERLRFPFHDSMVVAAALLSGCRTLYTEALQPGQVIDRQLTVINPFLHNQPGRLHRDRA